MFLQRALSFPVGWDPMSFKVHFQVYWKQSFLKVTCKAQKLTPAPATNSKNHATRLNLNKVPNNCL